MVLVAVLVNRVHADDSFVAKTQVYTDSDHTVVVSPLVQVTKDVWKGGTVSAGFVADAISSASIDVVTNATARMTDFRREVSASLAQKVADTTLSGGYIYSVENDYSSHGVHVGAAHDLLQKNVTLALGYALSLNSIGRTGDFSFHRSLTVNSIDASYTQVLGPRTIAQLSYSFQYANGYQSSPYRFVHIEAASDFKVPETEPGMRFRHALVAGVNRHLFRDSAIQVDARFYIDDWGVTSATAQLRYLVNFGNLTLRLRERFYYQSGASFFQPHYAQLSAYVTTDRELSDFWSNLAGIKLTWRLPSVLQGLSLEAKLDGFYFQYLNFAYLTNRIGANVELGLSLLY